MLCSRRPFLCCAWSANQFATHSREEWRGKLSRLAIYRSEPDACSTTGLTQDGRESAHTLSGTGPGDFLSSSAITRRNPATERRILLLPR